MSSGVLPLLISSRLKRKVSDSGKELSKVLVSSKKRLGKVEMSSLILPTIPVQQSPPPLAGRFQHPGDDAYDLFNVLLRIVITRSRIIVLVIVDVSECSLKKLSREVRSLQRGTITHIVEDKDLRTTWDWDRSATLDFRNSSIRFRK
ncbi:hypothetical protein Tco_0849072 [Tanacetum coccineum]